MSTFRSILVPTDFSDLSANTATYARTLAETHRAEIHVVHVVDPLAMTGGSAMAPGAGTIVPQAAMDVLLENGRAGVADFVRTHFAGLPTRSEVLIGPVHSEICQYAVAHGCDLIVIGSHARGVLHRVLLGSVSKAVLEHSPCPLLMVPLKAIEAEGAVAE